MTEEVAVRPLKATVSVCLLAAASAADDGSLLRQAFAASYGHCNFSPAELIAGVMAISHRAATGRWDSVAEPASLNQVASSLGSGLGPAQFISYYPGPLTGATGSYRHWLG